MLKKGSRVNSGALLFCLDNHCSLEQALSNHTWSLSIQKMVYANQLIGKTNNFLVKAESRKKLTTDFYSFYFGAIFA